MASCSMGFMCSLEKMAQWPILTAIRPVAQYIWGQFWVNNHAHVLTGKNHISSEHLYLLLRQIQHYGICYRSRATQVEPEELEGDSNHLTIRVTAPRVLKVSRLNIPKSPQKLG